jgi:hypothetical protein
LFHICVFTTWKHYRSSRKALGQLEQCPSPSNLPMYAIPREQPRARATGTATALPTCIYLHPKCTTQ